MKNNTLHRAFAFVHHILTAWNTHGENIHSPYLFYLVDKIIYDQNHYYSWHAIEDIRQQMLHSEIEIKKTDFGTGESGLKRVKDLARNELESPKIDRILARIIAFLTHEAERPLNIIELGTSLGITTAYLATAGSQNNVTTYEGSDEVAAIAQQNWQKLKINNIQLVTGNIDDTLTSKNTKEQAENKPVDLAFIDANHTYDATIRYYNILGSRAHEKTIIILDDIHHSEDMEQAWMEICNKPEVSTTMDLYHIGLVFLDKNYIKRNYKLRI